MKISIKFNEFLGLWQASYKISVRKITGENGWAQTGAYGETPRDARSNAVREARAQLHAQFHRIRDYRNNRGNQSITPGFACTSSYIG